MKTKIAKFAVVGHTNKGKSSIVSTLSQDDSIQISSRSGTTSDATAFRIKSHSAGYELIDTPGFQRPHKVLEWLKDRASSAEQRSRAVTDFIADEQCQQKFPDEVKLLKPLVEGAAILYVVDGSRPYGKEYEAEMEILRWSGQPSMALINPIESANYVETWKSALEQYFKMVRVFNPMDAEFDKQIELMQAFAHLNPDWTEQLTSVIAILKQQREQQKLTTATILARLVEDLCYHRVAQKVLDKNQASIIQGTLEQKYMKWMKDREQQSIRELFANYKHFQTEISVEDLTMPPDLFDCEQWYMWGLDKKQLAAVASLAGATAGAAVDMAVAGSSFMLGAIGGGIAGFTSAWFGAEKLQTLNIKGLPLGGYEASFGPIQNKNFPYVVIGRFLYIYQQISRRTHAFRDKMQIQECDLQDQISKLEKSTQKSLHQICDKLTKQKHMEGNKVKEVFSLLLN